MFLTKKYLLIFIFETLHQFILNLIIAYLRVCYFLSSLFILNLGK